jgi:hypothetical protein
MAMLDLNVFQDRFFDIKLFDGEVIHLPKPTQATILKLTKLEGDIKKHGEDSEKLLASFTELILHILNTNKEGRKFTAKWVDDNLNFSMNKAILEGYMEFANDLTSDPN